MKSGILTVSALSLLLMATLSNAKEIEEHNNLMDHGGGHLMDMGGGMVMGQNTETLPGGCDKIAATKEITVHAGHKYAEKFPGRMFAFDTQEYQFEPCTKLTVHFINEDSIRHQWMMHGLPKYLYPKGMFHLEVTGPGKISGTLILPPGDKTYLVHCDIAQHMEKGMKGQLKVGKGSGDLPSIPGVTAYVIPDDYGLAKVDIPVSQQPNINPNAAIESKPSTTAPAQDQNDSLISGVLVIGLAAGLLIAPFMARKFKGMSVSEVVSYLFELIGQGIGFISKLMTKLFNVISSSKNKSLPEK
ncbi:MAG: copper oxidase [Methylicorpusculum sp.]|nr:copper oxidase [Methylicorpusculum sp.]MDP2179098.1 copper oxidase [Methylicorpusculum sp.]MDP3528750.1 copper oxidase [Methylicorpusculum sp.]